MKTTEELKSAASEALASLYDSRDSEDIRRLVAAKEERFAAVPAERFALEYLAVKLTIASYAWENACAELGIQPPANGKIFLKTVLASFQSAAFMPLAEAFGDYLYAEGLEENLVVALVQKLFRRLNLAQAAGPQAGATWLDVFQALAAAAEGFRSRFENHLFEKFQE